MLTNLVARSIIIVEKCAVLLAFRVMKVNHLKGILT